RVVGLPTVEVLGVQASTVDPVLRPTAYPNDPVVLDRDVQCVTVGVQERRGPYPSVHILRTNPLGEMLVDPHGPLLALTVRGPCPPTVRRSDLSTTQGPLFLAVRHDKWLTVCV